MTDPSTPGLPVHIGAGSVMLPGELTVPREPRGTVVFAHGSGSSRTSPRNKAVAATLRDAGFATLLFDLLTEREAADRRAVFDIGLLASRLEAAMDEVENLPDVAGAPLGLFGASTGAAAALDAAASRPRQVHAVVSRGGRPDLARRLREVSSPTLLIVGSADTEVLALNRRAAQNLAGPVELEVVAGAGHLFERPGELDEVAALAARWFARHLVADDPPATARTRR